MSEYSAANTKHTGDVVATTAHEHKNADVSEKIASCISNYIREQLGPDATIKTENYGPTITAIEGTDKTGQILKAQIPDKPDPSQTYVIFSGTNKATPEFNQEQFSPENLKNMSPEELKEAEKRLSGSIDQFEQQQKQYEEPVYKMGTLNEPNNASDPKAYNDLKDATNTCIIKLDTFSP